MENINKIINEVIVNEIGNGNLPSYDFKLISKSLTKIMYEFDIEEDNYVCTFNKTNDDWSFKFYVAESDYDTNINTGNQYRVMSTILKIIFYFISKNDPSRLAFNPSDSRRANMYMAYIKSSIPDTYNVLRHGDEIIIDKKQDL